MAATWEATSQEFFIASLKSQSTTISKELSDQLLKDVS